jgi:hypothetical protein
LSALLPFLHQKANVDFLKSKQEEMKKWNNLLNERGSRSDKPIKPQVVASLLSDELPYGTCSSAVHYPAICSNSRHRRRQYNYSDT